jgi:gamma-glutamylcysteine synthetase
MAPRVVDRAFERRLAGLVNSGERAVLRGGLKGVEKESLRVTPAGEITQSRHPASLGAPLTNEHITTDFSEALIELVTPAFHESWELLQYLCDIHQFVYRHLDEELLWSTSMPASFSGDSSIPLAQFGASNVGTMKTIYRHGLGLRYGRIMQAISGVHFNYSFPAHFWDALEAINQSKRARQDFISEQYFGVLRNYRRFGWLVLYLGVKVDGEYRQLNANILQIENEYYSFIRPKRIATSGERPTKALRRGGVEYVEVRALDVSAFDPVGVNQNKLRFLEAFVALCALSEAEPIGRGEQEKLDANHLKVARRGREPGLMLDRDGRSVAMAQWARELLDSMQGICELLDHGEPSRPYATALEQQLVKVDDVERTPSARLLADMRQSGESFFDLALRMSRMHKDYFLDLYPPNESRLAEFAEAATASHEEQARIEAADKVDFDTYLRRYLAE